MKWRLVLHMLGYLALVVAAAMIPSFLFALAERSELAIGGRTLAAFGFSILGSVVLGLMLLAATRGADSQRFTPSEGFAVAALGWVLAGMLGAFPFWLAVNPALPPPGASWSSPGMSPGPGFGFVDGLFESVSGFSTTGSSVFGTPRCPISGGGIGIIEALPRSILFWRSLTHWLGGLGLVVLCLAILPSLKAGVYKMFQAEVPGPTADRVVPRVKKTAATLWIVYLIMTVVQAFLLWLGDMPLFDAVCHTFGTLATGGFSTKDASIGHYASYPHGLYLEIVIWVFMFLAGVNFLLHYQALRGNPGSYWRNKEFRFYCFILALGIGITFLGLTLSGPAEQSLETTFRASVFQVISITTTTGYGTADFNAWPGLLRALMVLLMFFGGCAGSTGGGFKQIRVMIVIRYIHRGLLRLLRPGYANHIRIDNATLEEELVANVVALGLLWIGIFACATVLMAGLIDGSPGGSDANLVTAATSVAATLNSIGPGLSAVGSTCNYGWMPWSAKLLLTFCMLLGRLEIYTVVVIILPVAWRS